MATSTITPELAAGVSAQLEVVKREGGWMDLIKQACNLTSYSVSNILWLVSQRENVSYVRGYRAWQQEGRQVIKGEKALKIRGYSRYKCKKTGEMKVRFPILSVFDITQTQPIEDADGVATGGMEALAGTQKTEFSVRLSRWLSDQGVAVRTVAMTYEGSQAYVIQDTTSASGYTIHIGQHVSSQEYLHMLLHETAHVLLGHVGDMEAYRRHVGQSVAEVEAESVALLVMFALGLECNTGYAYLNHWAQEVPGEDVQEVLSRCTETAQKILDALAA